MSFGNNGNGHRQFDKAQRVAYLIAGYIRNTLSEKERDELDEWICEEEANQDTFLELIDPAFLEQAIEERQSYDNARAIEKIREKLQFSQPAITRQPAPRRWLVPLAAAAVFLLALLLYWLWPAATTLEQPKRAEQSLADLLPGTGKATLTVAGGKVYELDKLTDTLIRRDSLSIIGENGLLRYAPSYGRMEMHTVTVPRGAQYQLQLPDGSMVWLNAESSITFPSVMNGPERRVQVTGELFFEVKKDLSQKFIVESSRFTTEVLGTKFNVNLHADDGRARVYLQEGSIRVMAGAERSITRTLIPGAMLSEANDEVAITHPREESVLAWKNGWFEFANASIDEIMAEVKRWYNVDVRYEGRISEHFNASIERDLPAAGLLELLEMTGKVKFHYKEGTIIVKP